MRLMKVVLSLTLIHLITMQHLDRQNFLQISATYFKARQVKSVTAISCFGALDDFWLMKGYLEAGFYVRILFSFEEFNVSESSKSGVVVDTRCDEMVTHLIKHESINTYMQTNVYWLFLENGSSSNELAEVPFISSVSKNLKVLYDDRFRKVEALPMTNVAVGYFDGRWRMFDVHKPYWDASVMWHEISCCDEDLTSHEVMKCALEKADKNSKVKRNLQGFVMPAATVITSPEYFTGMEALSDPIHDLFAKANYPFIKALMYDLNFTLNMRQVDSGGWQINGTFGGIMGLFQKRKIELSTTGVLMRPDRIKIVDYTIVTMLIESKIIFKQPPLSLVSNVFELPFSPGVWFCCGGFVIIYWLTFVVFRMITRTEPFTVQESLYYMIGTICQQNVELIPHFNSAKLMLFFAHLTSFFIFTSYSASIVALLQSPSQAISTVSDLAASPFKAGSMETIYAFVYFNESKDPAVQELFRKKMKPLGKKAFTEADVGMKRVRDEFYAFSVEVNAAYRLIKETFTPQDVCKVYELEAIKLPPFSIPMLKGTKYRELFRQRLIWQQEVGIIRRHNLLWIAQKPTCEFGVATFRSVGLNELRYVCLFMVIGFGLAFLLLGLEIIWKKVCSKRGFKTQNKPKLIELVNTNQDDTAIVFLN